jgi:hypothetical protein
MNKSVIYKNVSRDIGNDCQNLRVDAEYVFLCT